MINLEKAKQAFAAYVKQFVHHVHQIVLHRLQSRHLQPM